MAEQELTIEELAKRVGDLEKTVSNLQTENRQLKKAASSEKEPPKKPTIPEETFIVDGKKYKFVVPVFRHNGKDITAQDALSDDEILAGLVNKKSGLIKEVVE